jgi:hypothetical protein
VLDIESSVLVTKELLLYQFDNEEELVKDFLQSLYNVRDLVTHVCATCMSSGTLI